MATSFTIVETSGCSAGGNELIAYPVCLEYEEFTVAAVGVSLDWQSSLWGQGIFENML